MRNAGAVFVGPWSPVAAGDYATGGNHVLPTGGWARAVGGIGLETFLKPVTIQRLTADGLARAAADGRGARRGRGDAGARGGGAPMRALPAAFAAYRVGAVDRGARAARRARPGRRSCASTGTCPPQPSPLGAAGSDRGGARRGQRVRARRLPDARRRRSPTYAGVEPENVVLGAGADDLILLCARAFAGPGDTVAIAESPTYPLYRIAAQLAGAEVGDDDAGASRSAAVRTTRPASSASCPHARPLVVDEAYFEYAGETAVELIDDGVVVLRTFSKAFGLAGARVGYALADARDRGRAEPPAGAAADLDVSAALALAALARAART